MSILSKKISYLVCILLLYSVNIHAEVIAIDFAYVGEKDHSSILGIKQGVEESNLQGQFLNQKYSLDIIPNNDLDNHDFSKYLAVLTTLNSIQLKNLANRLTNTPIFNLTDESNELRLNCTTNILHVIPSSKMKLDALKQWKTKNPDSKAIPQAWHNSFVKFAARDLNKRFKKNHNIHMNDYSWAGWAAIKMTSDTVARTEITDTKKMLSYLKNDLTFDGQKGSDMNFRKNGQLRQLILLVENDKVIAEAPIRGVAKPPTLDSLGVIECSK